MLPPSSLVGFPNEENNTSSPIKPPMFILIEHPTYQLPLFQLFIDALTIFKVPISVSYTKGDSKVTNLTSKNDLKLLYISPIAARGRATVVALLIHSNICSLSFIYQYCRVPYQCYVYGRRSHCRT